jgi:hypothetical protein
MRFNRILRIAFAWASLMLPLQGYAVLAACEGPGGGSPSVAHHCVRESMTSHHHNCGDCCGGVAIAVASVPWIPPLRTPVKFSKATFGPPPKGLPERLDRPPRFVPA